MADKGFVFCQVRQVLTLALRRWGFQVCAVKNEEDAINKLTLQGKEMELHRLSHFRSGRFTFLLLLFVFPEKSLCSSQPVRLSVRPSVCFSVCLCFYPS